MKKEIGEKYLPIGTVVMLKGGTKRVMIVGFCAVEGQDSQMYDYSGCLYPEGLLSSNELCLFNHDQIEKVYYVGLAEDEEEKQYKEILKSLVINMDKYKELMEKNKIINNSQTKKEGTKIVDSK